MTERFRGLWEDGCLLVSHNVEIGTTCHEDMPRCLPAPRTLSCVHRTR